MRVEWSERFQRAYGKLQRSEQDRFEKALRLITQDPGDPSLHVKEVQGTRDVWEGRCSLKIRFTFEWIEGGIRLRNINDHDACLRNP